VIPRDADAPLRRDLALVRVEGFQVELAQLLLRVDGDVAVDGERSLGVLMDLSTELLLDQAANGYGASP
jgi:hypothetical protein